MPSEIDRNTAPTHTPTLVTPVTFDKLPTIPPEDNLPIPPGTTPTGA